MEVHKTKHLMIYLEICLLHVYMALLAVIYKIC